MNTSASDVATASIESSGDSRFKVQGILNFNTVPGVMKQAEKLFNKLDRVCVSFSAVTDSNSAGLALLLEMARYMKLRNKPIYFEGLPEQVSIIARAYGIDTELDVHLNSQDFLSV